MNNFFFKAWIPKHPITHTQSSNIYIYICAFSRCFYPKRLTIAFRLCIFISRPMCVPWESNPQPFALLTQFSTAVLILIGPKNSTQNILDHNLQLDGRTVISSTVKNLGVILDSNLSFENYISHVTKTAFFHLRNIAKLRNMLTISDAEKMQFDAGTYYQFLMQSLDWTIVMHC